MEPDPAVPVLLREGQKLQFWCCQPSSEHTALCFASSDGLLQGPGADGEDVTSSASPELMFSMDFDTEWEKEQLLKGERTALRKGKIPTIPADSGAAWGGWLVGEVPGNAWWPQGQGREP